jgi:tetratricopeptide (TPR) repeat protein
MTPKTATLSALLLAALLVNLPAAADPPPFPPVQIAQESELDLWNSIKDSKKAEDYQNYLDKYPDGNFADLAKLRVKKYAPAPTPTPEAAPAEAPLDPQQAEIAYWKSIKTSKDPEDYKAYLAKYPNGDYVDVAKLRVEQLTPAAAAPAEQPAQPTAVEQPKSAEPASVEPTPSPAPALTFEAKDAKVYAKNGGQVRAEPNTKAALVTKLKTNTEVHATGLSSDGKWWRVEVSGGSGGYMHASVISQQPVTVAAPSKKAEPPAAAAPPSGPDEQVCPGTAAAAPNDRVSACERMLAKAGDDKAKIAALGDLAVALSQARRYDEAIRKYEQAASLAPRDASIYYRIGLVRLDQLRFKEAFSAFEKAATIDNKDPDIVFQRGIAVMGFGDVEKAKLEVERALLGKTDAAYYEKLGEINIARGDLESAKVALDRGRKADPGRQSITLAAVNYFVGDNDAAVSQANAALGEPTALLWAAVIKKAKGDAAGAAQALEAGKATAGDDWPGPIFDALSGTLDLAKARMAAKAKDANARFEQLCALNFFAGEWAYLTGDKDAARAALKAALDTRAYWTLEFAAAKARLANMGG